VVLNNKHCDDGKQLRQHFKHGAGAGRLQWRFKGGFAEDIYDQRLWPW